MITSLASLSSPLTHPWLLMLPRSLSPPVLRSFHHFPASPKLASLPCSLCPFAPLAPHGFLACLNPYADLALPCPSRTLDPPPPLHPSSLFFFPSLPFHPWLLCLPSLPSCTSPLTATPVLLPCAQLAPLGFSPPLAPLASIPFLAPLSLLATLAPFCLSLSPRFPPSPRPPLSFRSSYSLHFLLAPSFPSRTFRSLRSPCLPL
mmetsp:Transcript_53467/g.116564  ORF Transcript_53467/g.116564 Transcript_53467/m.116564 type:complete len:204 (+) Transcript_53467:463-1074(+)